MRSAPAPRQAFRTHTARSAPRVQRRPLCAATTLKPGHKYKTARRETIRIRSDKLVARVFSATTILTNPNIFLSTSVKSTGFSILYFRNSEGTGVLDLQIRLRKARVFSVFAPVKSSGVLGSTSVSGRLGCSRPSLLSRARVFSGVFGSVFANRKTQAFSALLLSRARLFSVLLPLTVRLGRSRPYSCQELGCSRLCLR